MNRKLTPLYRFLWVRFQLDDLCTAETDSEILNMLDDLPADLNKTYDRLLSRITGRQREQLIRRMFEWIICAKRPLHIAELREAIAFTIDDDHWDAAKIPSDMARLIRACGNLIVIDEESGVAQFAHYTVEQYLLSAAVGVSCSMRLSLSKAKIAVAEVCLGYISFSDFESQLIKYQDTITPNMAAVEALVTSNSVLPREQLAGMVITMWERVHHRKTLSSNIDYSQHIPKRTMPSDSLMQKYKLLLYVKDFWLAHTLDFQTELDRSTRPFKLFQTLLLDKKLLFDIFPWTPLCLTSDDTSLNYFPAIGWAMEEGHALLIQVVLDTRRYPSGLGQLLFDGAKCIFGEPLPGHLSPDHLKKLSSFAQGHPNTIPHALSLLYTKFISSVRRGRSKIIDLLCLWRHDATVLGVKAYDFLHSHALLEAVMHEQFDMIRHLNWRGDTPITMTDTYLNLRLNAVDVAAFYGHKDIVLQLQDGNIKLHFTQLESGVTALVQAINNGSRQIVDALATALFRKKLPHGLHDTLGSLVSEALRQACDTENIKVVKFFLSTFASPNNSFRYDMECNPGGSPFRAAINNRQGAVIRIFLELWANIPPADLRFGLWKVAPWGDIHLVQSFIEYISIYFNGFTIVPLLQAPLYAAASKRNVDVIKLLLRHATFIGYCMPYAEMAGIPDSYSCTFSAIHQAASMGDFTAIDTLVSEDVSILESYRMMLVIRR